MRTYPIYYFIIRPFAVLITSITRCVKMMYEIVEPLILNIKMTSVLCVIVVCEYIVMLYLGAPSFKSKAMDKLFLLPLFFLLLVSTSLYAQPCNNPGIPIPPSPECIEGEACICDCELDGYCFTMSDQFPFGPIGPTPLCEDGLGTPHNMHWIPFRASSSSLILEITPVNCEPSSFMGIQAGIYEDCTFTNTLACEGECQTGPFQLVLPECTPGECYYLFIDGCIGNVCDIFIDVVSPCVTIIPPELDTIIGEIVVCEGEEEVFYTVLPFDYPGVINWVVPPGSSFTPINNNATQISVDFGDTGGLLCAYTPRGCYTEGDTSIITVTVLEPAIGTDQGEYCENEGGWFCPADGQFYSEGNYTIILPNASFQGCDSIIELTVTELPETTNFITTTICIGDSYEVCGIPYNIAGTYSIECSPNYNGCDSTIFLDLFVLEPIADIQPPDILGCGNNNTVYLDGFGSNGDYCYWETVDGQICDDPTSYFLQVCLPGTYCITAVLTQNGVSCEDQACVTVVSDSETPITTTMINEVSCPGEATGTATITVQNNSIGPFTYEWNPNVSITNTATGLGGGTYLVTITAANGCTSIETIIITEPEAIQLSTSGTDEQCAGDGSGTASVMPTGGTPPYAYIWCDGNTTNTAVNLSAGNCCVTVSDANSCTASLCYTVTSPAILACNTFHSDIQCNGENSGTGTIQGVGGTPPYSYLWCNGQTSATATGLDVGSCSVVVTDANGCTMVFSVTINEPSMINVNSMGLEVSCSGEMDGMAVVLATGGTGQLTYLWSNGIEGPENDGLAAGNFTVTITDENDCTETAQVTIEEPEPITVDGVAQDAICGENNGSINLTVNGGAAPYNFDWDSADNIQNPANLGAGNYTVTVTDSNGCTEIYSTAVSTPSELALSLITEDILCNNPLSGSIDLTVTGGTPPFDYNWNTGNNEEDLNNLLAGNYIIEVIDAAGCQVSASVSIEESEAIELAGITQAATCNTSNGTIELIINGGIEPYSYIWHNSEVTSVLSGLSPGSYSVTVADGNDCSQTWSTIIEGASVPVITSTSVDAICGENNGSINLTVNGGAAPYNFDWDLADDVQNPTNLGAGNYTVTVTDSNDCTEVYSTTINTPNELALSLITEDVFCNNALSGLIDLTVTGGTPPFDYNWSTGANQEDLNNLPAGNYIIEVVDATGYQISASTSIQESEAIDLTVITQAATCDSFNGAIELIVNGGVEPYSYIWDNNENTNVLSDLSPGSYSVTVTDGNDCSETLTTFIDGTSAPTVTGTSIEATCGEGNGSINLTVNGGTAPYNFDWDLADDVQNPTNLGAGNYTVTVTDNNGCTGTYSTTVSTPSELTLTLATEDILCNNALSGSIDLTVTGGTPPFDYNWSTGTNQEDLNNLPAGNYIIEVVDAAGCLVSASASIQESEAIELTVITQAATCDSSNGTIELIVNGGVEPYSYIWDNNENTNVLSSLSPGSYSVTVTDGNECSETLTTLIDGTSVPTVTGTSIQATCGQDNGSINLSVNGGAAPYEYNWDMADDIQNPTNLAEGNYSVTITDANSCTSEFSLIINSTSDLSLNLTTVDNACFSEAIGIIDLEVVGGTAPYSYLWNNNAITEDLSELSAGIYQVTVEDQNGCVAIANASITEPPLMSGTLLANDISCPGGNNGNLQPVLSGGQEPFTYLWTSGGSTDSELLDLPAGDYSLLVTDANSCTILLSQTLTAPSAIVVEGISSEAICGEENGSISLNVTGGTGLYTFLWSNGSTVQNPSNLSPGTYLVTVTDNNNCTQMFEQAVLSLEEVQLSMVSIASSCNGFADGAIELNTTGGQPPYYFSWNNGAITQNVNNLLSGEYFVTVTDDNGCVTVGSAIIEEPEVLNVVSLSPTNINCNGNNDGSIALTVTGGLAPYSYDWDNAPDIANPSNLGPGTYSVTVTDLNGCTAISSTILSAPPPILLSTVSTELTCFGATNGAIDLTVSGGTSPFQFNWNNGSQSEDLANLSGGTYAIEVTDANGCTEAVIEVLDEPINILAVTQLQDISCYGDENGSLTIEGVTGGTPPYLYALNDEPFTTASHFSNLLPGHYDLVIKDAKGCIVTRTEVIEEPSDLTIQIETSDQEETIELGDQVMLHVQMNRDTSSLQEWGWTQGMYWMDPNCDRCLDREIKPLEGTVYEFRVTDENGCRERSEITISVLKDQSVYIPNAFSPNGDGFNDYFQIHVSKEVKQIKSFLVFDRWGEVVFEMSDFYMMSPEEGWDGNLKGTPMNPAVYVYWVEVEFIDGQVRIMRGDITLIR